MKMTEHQKEAYLKIRALKQLATENGMSTRKSQNAVLQQLNELDLAVVASALHQNVSEEAIEVER